MLARTRLPLEADDEGQKHGKDKTSADPSSAAASSSQAPVTPAPPAAPYPTPPPPGQVPEDTGHDLPEVILPLLQDSDSDADPPQTLTSI